MNDMSYSTFMHGLKLANINLNRKVLADIAVNDEKAFAELVALFLTITMLQWKKKQYGYL